jgi:hypothetical protein
MAVFDERQQKEIRFSRLYATDEFRHGTDGHNAKLVIARMAWLLDKLVKELWAGPGLARLVQQMVPDMSLNCHSDSQWSVAYRNPEDGSWMETKKVGSPEEALRAALPHAGEPPEDDQASG